MSDHSDIMSHAKGVFREFAGESVEYRAKPEDDWSDPFNAEIDRAAPKKSEYGESPTTMIVVEMLVSDVATRPNENSGQLRFARDISGTADIYEIKKVTPYGGFKWIVEVE